MIRIADYLNQSKYIIEHLIELLNKIEYDLVEIQHKIGVILMYKQQANVYQKFAKQVWADGSEEEFSDFIVRGIEHAKTAQDYEEQVEQTLQVYNDALLIINSPLHSVAQAILQIAKQGISSRYGKVKSHCKDEFNDVGKSLPTKYGVSLLDIIWEGRNQSIHYEDRDFYSSVEDCFNSLLQNGDDRCQKLQGFMNGENKSYGIIKILEWDSYNNFEKDMLSLEL